MKFKAEKTCLMTKYMNSLRQEHPYGMYSVLNEYPLAWEWGWVCSFQIEAGTLVIGI